MKPDTTLKRFTAKEVQHMLDQAPEQADLDLVEEGYNPHDKSAVEAFWSKAKVVHPKRGKQKAPTKIPVSIRLSPEVVAYFKAGGEGWQTRLDKVLKTYVNEHREN